MLNWIYDKYHEKRWRMLDKTLREISGSELLADMYIHWPYVEDVNYDVEIGKGIFAKITLEGGKVIKGYGTYNEDRVLGAGEKYLDWLAGKWDI